MRTEFEKSFSTQSAECGFREWILTLPTALLHGGRETPHAIEVLIFMLDRKAGPAFIDRQADRASQQNISTELDLKVGPAWRLPAHGRLQFEHDL